MNPFIKTASQKHKRSLQSQNLCARAPASSVALVGDLGVLADELYHVALQRGVGALLRGATGSGRPGFPLGAADFYLAVLDDERVHVVKGPVRVQVALIWHLTELVARYLGVA